MILTLKRNQKKYVNTVENKENKKIVLYDPEKNGTFKMMFGFGQPFPPKHIPDSRIKRNINQKK